MRRKYFDAPKHLRCGLGAIVVALLSTARVPAQNTAVSRPRITQPIDNRQRIVLAGNIHPKAIAAALAGNDQGRVSPSLAMPYITLMLAPSAGQQADLENLLAQQQTPGSADYHHWLTPEEYGQRFGVNDADLSQITQWLQQQGLQVVSVARGRNWIAASGTAAQAEVAFQTEIHSYAGQRGDALCERVGAVRSLGFRLSGEKHSWLERFPDEAAAAPVARQTELQQA